MITSTDNPYPTYIPRHHKRKTPVQVDFERGFYGLSVGAPQIQDEVLIVQPFKVVIKKEP